MTPAPGSANSLVYVSWNKSCPQSKKVWEMLSTHCKGIHNPEDFRCLDRDGLDNIYPKTRLDDMLCHFRLAVILLSAKHATSPSWWQDEVLRLLIPANGRHLTVLWQQIDEFNVPPDLAEITPLERHNKSLWSPNKLNDSALLVSTKIQKAWEQTPSFSQALPDLPPSQPKGLEAAITRLPISHVALVIRPTAEIVQSQPRYTFSLYHRHHDAEHYDLLTHIGEARGFYTFPWSTRSPTTRAPQAQTSHNEEPPEAPPVCPVLLRLLEWAQRQNSEFILEIFAPQALLHLNWGELLAPPAEDLEPLVQAHPFLLRSSDRLGRDYQSKTPRLRQKWELLNSPNGSWRWVDGNSFQPTDWSSVLSAPDQVAIQRSTPLAERERRDWLRGVLRSMVPLALWPHPSTPPPNPKDTADTDTAAHQPKDTHPKVMALCQQALQACPPQTRPPEPDLDQLAQLRFANQVRAMKNYAILVDHPTRRPLLEDADPLQSSPNSTDLLISC